MSELLLNSYLTQLRSYINIHALIILFYTNKICYPQITCVSIFFIIYCFNVKCLRT